jgi:hypothetical protein
MAQTQRTLMDTVTSLSGAEVLVAAKRFFGRNNSVYTAFLDMEGPTFVSLRGMGGEEIVIGVSAKGNATLVTGSTYLFDQQVARFLSSLPAPDAAGVAELPAELPESAEVSA